MHGTFEEPPTGLIPWFSKAEGNTYATIAASPFPLQGKPTQAQDVAGGEKRKAAPSGEAEGSKKGKTLPPDHSTTAAYSDEEWLPRDKPLAKS